MPFDTSSLVQAPAQKFDTSSLIPAPAKLDTSKLTAVAAPKLDTSSLKPVKELGILDKVRANIAESTLANNGEVPSIGRSFKKAIVEGAKTAGEGISDLINPDSGKLPVESLAKAGSGVARAAAAPIEAIAVPELTALLGPKKGERVGLDVSQLIQVGAGAEGTTGAPETIKAAAIKTPEGIITGKNHDAAYEAAGIPRDKNHVEGFVTDKRPFISREEAAVLGKQTGQAPVAEKPGQLHSEDVARAAGQPASAGVVQSKIFSPDEPTATTQGVTTPKGIADRLYADKQRMHADQAELLKYLQTNVKNVPAEVWDKIGEHMDNPKEVSLTPQEAKLKVEVIDLMRAEREAAEAEILGKGYKVNDLLEDEALGGATRQVKGKNTPLDRLLGTVEKSPVGKRSLSKTAGTMKGRSMMAFTDMDGVRKIAYVAPDGRIMDASKPNTQLGVKNADGTASGGKLSQATRNETEKATENRIEYHRNSLGIEATALLQARRALRATRTLNETMKSPQAADVIRPIGDAPKDWVSVERVPAFRDYKIEPQYAEEIQDFLDAAKPKEGLMKALEGLNRFMIGSFFG